MVPRPCREILTDENEGGSSSSLIPPTPPLPQSERSWSCRSRLRDAGKEEEENKVEKVGRVTVAETGKCDEEQGPETIYINSEDEASPPAGPSTKDTLQLCVFDSVIVRVQDFVTLEYDVFVNDIIIDFYLRYCVQNFLSEGERSSVHVFSTMFSKVCYSDPKGAQ